MATATPDTTLTYEDFRDRLTALCAEYECLCVTDFQQWNAAATSNAIDDLMERYPAYHARFAAELCAATAAAREYDY